MKKNPEAKALVETGQALFGLRAEQRRQYRGLENMLTGVSHFYYNALDTDIQQRLGTPNHHGLYSPDRSTASRAVLGHAARLNLPNRIKALIDAYNEGNLSLAWALRDQLSPLIKDLGELNSTEELALVKCFLTEHADDVKVGLKRVVPLLEQRLHLKAGALSSLMNSIVYNDTQTPPEKNVSLDTHDEAEEDEVTSSFTVIDASAEGQEQQNSIQAMIVKTKQAFKNIVAPNFHEVLINPDTNETEKNEVAKKALTTLIKVMGRLDNMITLAINGADDVTARKVSAPIQNSQLGQAMRTLSAMVEQLQGIQSDMEGLDLNASREVLLHNMHALGGEGVDAFGKLLLIIAKSVDILETEIGLHSDESSRQLFDLVKPLYDQYFSYAPYFEKVSIQNWNDLNAALNQSRSQRIINHRTEMASILQDIEAFKQLKESMPHLSATPFATWPKASLKHIADLYRGDDALIDIQHAATFLTKLQPHYTQLNANWQNLKSQSFDEWPDHLIVDLSLIINPSLLLDLDHAALSLGKSMDDILALDIHQLTKALGENRQYYDPNYTSPADLRRSLQHIARSARLLNLHQFDTGAAKEKLPHQDIRSLMELVGQIPLNCIERIDGDNLNLATFALEGSDRYTLNQLLHGKEQLLDAGQASTEEICMALAFNNALPTNASESDLASVLASKLDSLIENRQREYNHFAIMNQVIARKQTERLYPDAQSVDPLTKTIDEIDLIVDEFEKITVQDEQNWRIGSIIGEFLISIPKVIANIVVLPIKSLVNAIKERVASQQEMKFTIDIDDLPRQHTNKINERDIDIVAKEYDEQKSQPSQSPYQIEVARVARPSVPVDTPERQYKIREKAGMKIVQRDEYRALRENMLAATSFYYDQLDSVIKKMLGPADHNGLFHPSAEAASVVKLHAARLNLPRRVAALIYHFSNNSWLSTGSALLEHAKALIDELGKLTTTSEFELAKSVLGSNMAHAKEALSHLLPSLEERLHLESGVLQKAVHKIMLGEETMATHHAESSSNAIHEVKTYVASRLEKIVKPGFLDQLQNEETAAEHNHQMAQKAISAIVNVINRLDVMADVVLNGVARTSENEILSPMKNTRLLLGIQAISEIMTQMQGIKSDIDCLSFDDINDEFRQNLHSMGGDGVESIGQMLLVLAESIDVLETQIGFQSDEERRVIFDITKPLFDQYLKYAPEFEKVSIKSWQDIQTHLAKARDRATEMNNETIKEKTQVITDLTQVRDHTEALRHYSDFSEWPEDLLRYIAHLYQHSEKLINIDAVKEQLAPLSSAYAGLHHEWQTLAQEDIQHWPDDQVMHLARILNPAYLIDLAQAEQILGQDQYQALMADGDIHLLSAALDGNIPMLNLNHTTTIEIRSAIDLALQNTNTLSSDTFNKSSDLEAYPNPNIRNLLCLIGPDRLRSIETVDEQKTQLVNQVLTEGDRFLVEQHLYTQIPYLDIESANKQELIAAILFNNNLLDKMPTDTASEDIAKDQMPQSGWLTGISNFVNDTLGYVVTEYPSAALSRSLVSGINLLIEKEKSAISDLQAHNVIMLRKQEEVLYPIEEDLYDEVGVAASDEAEISESLTPASDENLAEDRDDESLTRKAFRLLGDLLIAIVKTVWNVIKLPFRALYEKLSQRQANPAEEAVEYQTMQNNLVSEAETQALEAEYAAFAYEQSTQPDETNLSDNEQASEWLDISDAEEESLILADTDERELQEPGSDLVARETEDESQSIVATSINKLMYRHDLQEYPNRLSAIETYVLGETYDDVARAKRSLEKNSGRVFYSSSRSRYSLFNHQESDSSQHPSRQLSEFSTSSKDLRS